MHLTSNSVYNLTSKGFHTVSPTLHSPASHLTDTVFALFSSSPSSIDAFVLSEPYCLMKHRLVHSKSVTQSMSQSNNALRLGTPVVHFLAHPNQKYLLVLTQDSLLMLNTQLNQIVSTHSL